MSGKMKVSGEMIRSYDGSGDTVAWLTKAKLVADLMGIENVASFIPLYLEGDALALYLEMPDTDKKSLPKIEERLKRAFAQGRFEAFAKLACLKWTGEQVDVFANEARRLAGLAEYTGEGLELTVKHVFINGFPDRISKELQREDFSAVTVGDLIARARTLAAGCSEGGREVAAVASRDSGPSSPVSGRTPRRLANDGNGGPPREFKGRCFRCGGPHMVRDCKEPKPLITCYRCGREGHIANRCVQGNGVGGAAAPGATPSEN